jgi:hypothetical protein
VRWFFSFLVILLPAVAPAQSDGPQIVFVGHIRKIDTKTRIITVTEKVFPDHSGRRGMPLPINLEGTGSAPGGFEDFPSSPVRRGGMDTETKVTYSPATMIKSTDKQVELTDLKIGDSVRVTGRTSNKEVAATEIQVLPQITSKGKRKP